MWMIIGGTVLVAGFLVWKSRRPKTFSYRGKTYSRHSDGSITYVDGGFVATSELDEVQDYWESTNDSSDSSDSNSDSGGDSGGGDGGGGGGD
jgi:uncharacterized membrane protein YgcG